MGTQPIVLIQVCSQVFRSPTKYIKTAYISGLLWLQRGSCVESNICSQVISLGSASVEAKDSEVPDQTLFPAVISVFFH